MRPQEIIVGARVKCVYQGYGGHYGKIGTITQDTSAGCYWVLFDGESVALSWADLSSFELVNAERRYILRYIQNSCWDKKMCVKTERGYEAYCCEPRGIVYTLDPMCATVIVDINEAHRIASKDTADTYRTLVEELP